MRDAVIGLLLFLAAATLLAQAPCPTQAPGNVAITTTCAANLCPNGPITLTLKPFASGGFPPAPYDPGYTIAPCDHIVWDFGDQSSVSVTGLDAITHDFAQPGNYHVTASVTNVLGARTYELNLLAATSPAKLGFAAERFNALETAGSATVTIRRSLDLSRTTVLSVWNGGDTLHVIDVATRTLTFAPGETEKSFAIPIHDDSVYEGTRYYPLAIAALSGGAYWDPYSGGGSVVIQDDEPQPTLWFEAAQLREGDSGRVRAYVPVHLTAPLASPLNVWGFVKLLPPPSASAVDIDLTSDFVQLAAGETTAMLPVTIFGDRRVEPDEQFSLKTILPGATGDPLFAGPVVCTIVNDDASLTPDDLRLGPGESATLHLDVGNPVAAATTMSASSSTPGVLTVDAVTMQGGSATADVVVHALAEGVTTIEVPFPDGRAGTPARATVTVQAEGVLTAMPPSLALRSGEERTITLTIDPSPGSPQTVVLASADPAIAQVAESVTIPAGSPATTMVRALRPGATSISAAWAGGTVSVAVTVTSPRPRAVRP